MHCEYDGKREMRQALLRCDNFVYVTVPDRPDDNDLCPSTILFSLTPYIRWDNRDRRTVSKNSFHDTDRISLTFTSKAKPVAVRFNDLGLNPNRSLGFLCVVRQREIL